MGNLIDPVELKELLGDPSLRIVDTRFDLGDPNSGERSFGEARIPGAIYAHLDRDLSGPLAEHGGRHPLPDPDTLARWLGRHGVANRHLVVAYDAGSGMFAGRMWWLLKFLGHERVKVLDGGLKAWLDAGFPLGNEPVGSQPAYPAERFVPKVRSEMMVDRDYILRNLGNPALRLVDARAPERYRGEVEPIDPRAGHIPSAINLPFAENLEAGRFKGVRELRERFESLDDAPEVVVYCGSGVSAAHDLLAMEEAGLANAKLYPGSWSDWSSYGDSPIATGEEPGGMGEV